MKVTWIMRTNIEYVLEASFGESRRTLSYDLNRHDLGGDQLSWTLTIDGINTGLLLYR
jgi:hypothetical protein